MAYSIPVKVGDKYIGDGHPIFIMADVGLTNGGDLKRSLKLIDIAKDLGVDAVKFQMIGPDVLLGDKTITYTYPTLTEGKKTENMYEMFSALSYTFDEWKKIANAAWEAGLEFICTSHYLGAVDLLEEIGVYIHKTCSWSVTDKRLVKRIGKTRKPLIFDTGTFSLASLLEFIDWYNSTGGREIIILHDYHTDDVSQMNFRNIAHLKNLLGCPIGYTPPGRETLHDYMSIGLGVNVLEKRLTVDCKIPKNGHWKSLEPDEFRIWLKNVRDLEASLGSLTNFRTDGDLEKSKIWFKSLFAAEDIKKGEVITDDMINCSRPGTGIPASSIEEVVGKVAKFEIRKGTMVKWADVL